MSCYFMYLLALIKFIAINVFHCTLCLCMSFLHSFHFLRKRQYFNVYVHTYILSRAYNKYLRNKCKNNNSMQLFFRIFLTSSLFSFHLPSLYHFLYQVLCFEATSFDFQVYFLSNRFRVISACGFLISQLSITSQP